MTHTASAALVRVCTEHGLTVACAESLTAGLVCARIADVPGASAVLRGGLVVYVTELKHELLSVDAALLAQHGPVHAEVAKQMATAIRTVFHADLGLATTGVAGPGPADGHPAGTVHIAVDHDGQVMHRQLALPGERSAVRAATVDAVLELVMSLLTGWSSAVPGGQRSPRRPPRRCRRSP